MQTRALCLAVLLAACSDSQAPSPTPDAGLPDAGPPSARLRAEGRFFRDAEGRAVLLRGVNARVQGVFDVTFDDGRVAVEELPPFGPEDCRRMAELGFNFLRLPINWSAVEPERDRFDDGYLARVDEVIDCMAAQGIHVLVDLHQDAYSKEIGEDGAPLWAIVPEPSMLLEGPLTEGELARRRVSADVLNAFASFFAEGDPHGLVAEYLDMVRHVAAHFAANEHVLGIDLFNEPVSGRTRVASLMAEAGRAMHEVAPELIAVFEPSALWSANGGERAEGAYPVPGSAYAPHLYELSITGDTEKLETVTREDLLPAFRTAASEAQRYESVWLVGEFGAGPSTTNYERYLDLHYDLQDEFLVSSALWLWKESSQGAWGLYDFMDGEAREREAMVKVVSRAYAARIAGTPTAMTFEDDALRFRYEAAVAAPHVVYVPERLRATSARCDGTETTLSGGHGFLELTCAPAEGAHEVVITLAP